MDDATTRCGRKLAWSVLAQFERGQSRDHERQDADYSVRPELGDTELGEDVRPSPARLAPRARKELHR